MPVQKKEINMNWLRKILGLTPAADYGTLVKAGAKIIDVRSAQEFQSGHVPKAINIPLDQLASQLHRLKDKQQPIITCCVTGARSGNAKRILQAKGYQQVYNGGNWARLGRKISS